VISLKFSSEFRPGPRFSVNRAIRVNLAENLDGIRSHHRDFEFRPGIKNEWESLCELYEDVEGDDVDALKEKYMLTYLLLYTQTAVQVINIHTFH
jgi:hypothetical protein